MKVIEKQEMFEDMLLRVLMVSCAAVMVGLVLGLGAYGVAYGVDVLSAVRAERKAIACEAKRMDYRRVKFTTEVTCVPRSLDTRNDTLTIKQEVGRE